jgi:zinc transporter ZupT
MEFIWEPFILSLIAGMATGIGGLFVLMLRRVSDRAVSFSLGFASARAGRAPDYPR